MHFSYGMIKMELRALRYFLAVAQEENFTQAAKRLHVSQPNVSRQIHDLEIELGTRLFDRNQTQVKLTSSGRYLESKATQLITLADSTIDKIQQDNLNISGTIHISTGESHAMMPVIEAISKITHKYSSVNVTLVSTDAEGVMRDLNNGISELGIIMGYSDDRHYNSMQLPEMTRWGLLIKKESPYIKQRYITTDDFQHMRLILPLQKQDTGFLNSWFEDKIEKVNIVARYNLINNAVLLVKAGVGNALCLDGIVNLDNDLIFLPLYPQLTSPMNIIWRKNDPLTTPARYLLETIKEKLYK